MKVKEINSPCQACLTMDRQLRPISEVLTLIEDAQITEMSQKAGFICWECVAMLRNVSRFRQQVRRAQNYLKGVKKKKQSFPTLSSLEKSSTKLDYDYTYTYNETDVNDEVKIKLEFEECIIKQEIIEDPLTKEDEETEDWSNDSEDMPIHRNTIGLNVNNSVESYVQLYPLREPKQEEMASIQLVAQPATSVNEDEITEKFSHRTHNNLAEYRVKNTDRGRFFVFTRLFAFNLWYEKNQCRKDERIHHVVRSLRNCLSDEDKLLINNDELIYKVNSLCTRMNRHLNKTRKFKDRFLLKYTNWLKDVETVRLNFFP